MRIGFIGCGNMASALARGLGEPVVCSDVDAARARALAEELGGEALATNGEVFAAADAVVLCHKPAQLDEVAAGVDAAGKIVLSLLGGVTLERIRAAYPGATAYRFMPNIAVAIQRGAIGIVADDAGDPQAFGEVRALLERVGEVVELPEAQLDIVTATAGVAPAYVAVIAEAWIDAAVRRGMPAATAERLVGASLEGGATLLRERGMDSLGVRRAVTSPGGVTAAGLRALERGGLRTAMQDALDAVLERSSMSAVLVIATARETIADYLQALIFVYIDPDLHLHRLAAVLRLRWPRAIQPLARTRCSSSCARSASPTCRSSGASSRRSARSTSARSSRSCVLQFVGGLIVDVIRG